MDGAHDKPTWVVIEGPGPGDAEFLGRWLLAATVADRTLEEQFIKKPTLREQIATLEIIRFVSFSPAATRATRLLMTNLCCFSLDARDEWGELFVIMAQIGFYRLTGDRYQMTIPQDISGSRIESGLLALAATEDKQYNLHPEYLVTCLSKRDAEIWEIKLACLPWPHRVADRNVLLS
ncbi:hypothetical protein ACVMAJ_006844 [Bradyrhizobium sp. USDA 4448]